MEEAENIMTTGHPKKQMRKERYNRLEAETTMRPSTKMVVDIIETLQNEDAEENDIMRVEDQNPTETGSLAQEKPSRPQENNPTKDDDMVNHEPMPLSYQDAIPQERTKSEAPRNLL